MNAMQTGRPKSKIVALALAFLMGAWPLLASTPTVTFPPPHSTIFMSRDQDVPMGQQAAQEARKQFPVVPDSDPLTQYVRRLGNSLVPYVPEPRFPYEFHVVNEKDINAFALPGGPVFVNVGTIQAADNEAQLAGVIAHEMGHVYMRHGAQMVSNQMKAELPLGVLGAIVGHGVGGQVAQIVGSLVANGYLLKNSRTAESEADAVGARLMYLAGYNPQAMADFFRKLEEEGGSRGPQMLSDHPDPGNRAQAIESLIRTLPSRSFSASTGGFQQAKQIATGRRPLTAQQIAQQDKQGGFNSGREEGNGRGMPQGDVSRSDAGPSSQMRQFNHSAFTISYPSNWQVMGDATSAVTIAPPNGVTQNAVAYGAIISGFQPESQDLDSATHELEQSLRQSNPDLRVLGNDENIRVNGIGAKSVEMLGSSPVQGQRERDWLVTIPSRQNGLIYVVFIAPENDFNSLRPTFENMLRSLRLK